MAGTSSTDAVAAEGQLMAMASRQWSCSELKEGLKQVCNDASMPPELAELEACFYWKMKAPASFFICVYIYISYILPRMRL